MANHLISFFEQLADETQTVRSMDLIAISDLSRDQVAEFRTGWDALRPGRRLELITAMVEQAETNIHLIFHATLRACLTDDDAQVRRLAIEGLWEDERVGLVPTLSDLLAHDPSADVRSTAATALGRFVLLGVLGDIAEEPARQAEDALHLAWERSGEPVSVRRRVLESLAPTDTADLHVLIGDAYSSDNELMRQSAIFAMGRSANPRWNKIVLSELNSREAAIRFEAAEAAGELGLRAAVQPLIQRLDDPDKDVQEAAALALGKIGGPAARRALESLVAGDDERLAEAAAEALEELMFNSTHLDDALLDYSDESASHRSRTARSVDEDLVFPKDDDLDELDDADDDGDTDDWDWDDSEGDGDDGDDWDEDEEDVSFDDEDDEDDLDFDDVDLDR